MSHYEKLSAAMSVLMSNYEANGAAGLLGKLRFTRLSLGTTSQEPPSVHVFVRCDERAQLSALRQDGIAIHQTRGTVRTGVVRLDKVELLAKNQDVYRIAPARQLRPLLEVATKKTNVATFKNQSNLTGKGVIVGIVDSGVDTTHPALVGRILSFWDQTIPGPGWGTTAYGQVLSGATLPVGTDQNGHGTHVAGIAAGNDAKYRGVAHESELIVVKTNFSNTGIADGVQYVFSQAAERKQPAVVNLSLGGHGDAHDGSDDLATVINQETGPGRIVVAAAGNEGDEAIHGAADVAPGATAIFRIRVTPSSQPGAAAWVVLNGWYAGKGQCEIAVHASTGGATQSQGVLSASAPTMTYQVQGAEIRVTTPPATVNPNNDHQFLVEFLPGAHANTVQGGIWQLLVKNVGKSPCRIDIWSLVPEDANTAAFLGVESSTAMKIGSPGTSASAVTVAAYTTRNTWTDSSGAVRSVGLALDTICDFSSPGPLRDRAEKPDVTAPGGMLISALSSQSHARPSEIVVGGFRVMAGTSMASPLVAGIVALLLQRDPQLGPDAIKAILRANSTIPGQTPGSFDPRWGWGLVDATNL